MIDSTHAFWMFEKRHPPLPPQAPRFVQTQQNMRRAVWRVLVDFADAQGCFTTTMREIAQRLRDHRPAPAWGTTQTAIKNVQHAIRGLRQVGLVNVTGSVDIGDGGQRISYQLCLDRPTPVNPLPRRTTDGWLRAFDERAATWSHERRRRWRAIWRAIMTAADNEGYFHGDIAALTDAASDRLNSDVADQTVADVLRWSLASKMTEVVHAGRPARYRILPDRRGTSQAHSYTSSAC